MYEAAFARALTTCGVRVSSVTLPGAEGWRGRMGPIVRSATLEAQAARRLLAAAAESRPDWVLLWRPTTVAPATVQALQARGIRVATFNNDDPFTPGAPRAHTRLWSRYRSLLPVADHHFVYRPVNVHEAYAAGARRVSLLPPYFIPWRDRPLTLDAAAMGRFGTDVVFAGHYEPDGRAELICSLVRAGLRVRIWSGADWDRRALGDCAMVIGPIQPALDDDYARAVAGASVALGLLSTANRDVYTRRCLEIPACGRVLLAPRTAALEGWFRAGEEACFYSSTDELVEIARALVRDGARRGRIADAGRRRVWADGHDVVSRARLWLRTLHDDGAAA